MEVPCDPDSMWESYDEPTGYDTNRYSHLLASYPLLVIFSVLVIAGTGIVISLVATDLPDFSDPQLGFESRGTEIAGRLKAWHNLLEESRPSGSLTTNPSESESLVKKKWKKSKKKFRDKNIDGLNPGVTDFSRPVRNIHSHTAWGYMVTAPSNNSDPGEESSKHVWRELSHYREFGTFFDQDSVEPFFCDVPNPSDNNRSKFLLDTGHDLQAMNWAQLLLKPRNGEGMEYSHFVLKSKSPEGNILDLQTLREICFLDLAIRHQPGFEELCTTPHESTDCCRSWSLPNYIALLTGRRSCEEITELDVTEAKDIICSCFTDCTDSKSKACKNSSCISSVIADGLRNFLVGEDDLNKLKERCDNMTVQYSGILLPLAKSTGLTTFYQDLVLPPVKEVEVVGYDFGVKTDIFNLYLKRDLTLLLIGAVLVGTFMWIFLQSLLATLAVFLSILMSVGMAYFVYTFVFKIRFFPFVNLLVLIIALGVGVDDAFIYFHHWKRAKLQLDGSPLGVVVSRALGASAPAMLVTSLTTSASCFASYASDVTALKAFGIFTGTTILLNYFLVVSWLPAVIVLVEKCPSFLPKPRPPQLLRKLFKTLQCSSLIKGIELLRYFLVVLFVVLTVLASVSVFYYPKFSLPSDKEFRLFVREHPFEVYNDVKDKFLAGKAKEVTVALPLRFVFGVLPTDNGDYLEPSSDGKLVLDQSFNASGVDAQVWLLNFCRNLRRQDFVDLKQSLFFKNCFIETLISFMERPCSDPISGVDRSPCCASSKFPFGPSVFDQCLTESAKISEAPVFFAGTTNAGPRFFRDSKKLAAFVIEYDSNYTYSSSYTEMEEFFREVELQFRGEVAKAPEGLKNGFFVSYLDFYDLQLSLTHGTMISVLISLSVSMFLLFCSTRSILVSLSSAIVTFSIVVCTLSILIALGWELNVLESASISLAIGMSVDYALHFAVAWSADGGLSANSVLSSVGLPVCVAAVTTILPGIVMLFSSILVYKQIGIFVITVTLISLCFSVFFLLPLLLLSSQKFCGGLAGCLGRCCRKNERSDPSCYLSVPTESHIISLSSSSNCVQSLPAIPKGNSVELEPLGNV